MFDTVRRFLVDRTRTMGRQAALAAGSLAVAVPLVAAPLGSAASASVPSGPAALASGPAALGSLPSGPVAVGSVGTTPAAVPPPNQDPFYRYSGDLGAIRPGTILKERSVELVLAEDTQTPVRAEQLLFRTSNELGRPALAVTTVIPPVTGPVHPKILSWQPFYDSLGDTCDPSYVLRGGGGSNGCDDAQDEETGAMTFLAQGDTIVMTDYEETTNAFGAGRLEGYATLDGIRAAETYLHDAPRTTPVALVGYSGGAIATQWAAELAPAYAPGLDLVGAAAGGVLVDPFQTYRYINGNATGWADVLPVYLVLLHRAFGEPVAQYLSALGKKIYAEDRTSPIGNLAPVSTMQSLLKPQYQHLSQVRPFVEAMNQLIMGSDGTPRTPMFLANGEGIENNGYDGDGIMITADVEALAHEYCQRGVPVEFQQYDHLDHVEAFVPFITYAVSYLTDRLNGLPAPSDCSSIGPGNSIAPQPVPRGRSGS
jgi:pimeloyl-ACP methyl ester carboxylesterase